MGKPQLDDANAFLLGSESVPSASFLTKGTTHEGEVLEIAKRQQLDIDSKKPMFWENGDPKMQVVVTIQTDELDDEIEDDDGRRRLYVKYKMKDAIADAIREADCADVGLEVGGWLSVTFTKQDKPANRAKSGTKHFEAKYEPPDEQAAANEYLMHDDPNEGDDQQDDEPEKPARTTRQRGREAASKPASGRRGRAPAEDTNEPEKPARGRRQPATAGARRGSGRSSRSEYVNDGDDGDEPY